MIEEHYGNHIKDRRDVAAINVQRPKAVQRASRKIARVRKANKN
jgi:hypothetical protein